MAGCWRSLSLGTPPDLRGDFSLATELADFLAVRGVPFREAHRVVGCLVRLCEARGVDLGGLTAADLEAAHPALAGKAATEALSWLDPAAAAERRTSFGGTAWAEVIRQVGLLTPAAPRLAARPGSAPR